MSITLRVNKGSALTYDEMDRNLASYYYSSSIHNQGSILRLHYTGSTILDTSETSFTPRHTDINITGTFSGSNSNILPASTEGSIQYRRGNVFAGQSSFTYNESSQQVGIGTTTPTRKVHISGDTSQAGILRISSTSLTSTHKRSYIEFLEANKLLGYVGRFDNTNSDIYINSQTGGSIRLTVGSSDKATVTSNGIGVGTLSPNHPLTVVGVTAIGSDTTPTTQTLFSANTGQITTALLPAGSVTTGLVVESPKTTTGGHIIIGINTNTAQDETFSVVGGTAGVYNSNLLTVRADAKVGIGNRNPTQALTVTGNISGSGDLIINGKVEIGEVPTALSYSNKTLTIEGGEVRQAAAAPIPIGGIIMWSGLISNIPIGWSLCNGTNGTPNLQDRFIVGAGSSYTVGATGGSSDAIVVEHSHTGTTSTAVLRGTVTKLSETFNDSATTSGVFSKTTGFAESNTPADVDTSNTGQLNFNADHSHTLTTNTVGSSGINANLPPYYALAYIMYVG